MSRILDINGKPIELKNEKKNFSASIVDTSSLLQNYNQLWEHNSAVISYHYSTNPILYKAIDLIASNTIDLDICYKNQDGEIIEKPPVNVVELWDKPYPMSNNANFLRDLIVEYCLYDEVFIWVSRNPNAPQMRVIKNSDINISSIDAHMSLPTAYQVQENRFVKRKLTDYRYLDNNDNQLLHLYKSNPFHYFKGCSGISAIFKVIDGFSLAQDWNNSLLKNNARPSGFLKTTGDYTLSAEDKHELSQELQNYSGSQNAGRPMLLDGGIEFIQASFNPKDVEFVQALKLNAALIASHLGVPSQMLGISDQQTYNNFAEARVNLYESAILPKYKVILDFLSDNIFMPKMGVRLEYDLTKVDVYKEREMQKMQALQQIDYLSTNEKRAMLGLPEVDNGDMLYRDFNKVPIGYEDEPIEPQQPQQPQQDEPNTDTDNPA